MAKAPIYLPRGLARAFALALLGVILSLGVAVPKAAANPLDSIGAAVMQLLGIGDAEPAAAFGEEKTVDPSTIATWSDIIQNDTENIGRIWTDKTVSSTSVQLPASPDGTASSIEIGDSDFLVTLSALSSTSNTTTTSSKPLDIVLVLDASGSMAQELTSEYRYSATYGVNTNGRTTYYAQDADGSYAEIDRVTSGFPFYRFDHWELNGQTVNPKTSAQDSDPSHIQFYTYDEVTTTKMAALHDAANAFIENTAKLNDNIDDTAKQHRISLVKFASDKNNSVGNDTMGGWNDYNYSQVMTNLTAYTSADVSSATSMIDGLTASGATSADYGMQHAQTVLASAREDAQKVASSSPTASPTIKADLTARWPTTPSARRNRSRTKTRSFTPSACSLMRTRAIRTRPRATNSTRTCMPCRATIRKPLRGTVWAIACLRIPPTTRRRPTLPS